MIVVEDGTGKPDSNSYCDIDFADAYHLDRGNAWTGLDADKAAALIRATDYLKRYRARWKGYRTFVDQALDWPRARVVVDEPIPYYPNNTPGLPQLAPPNLSGLGIVGALSDDVIPEVIKQATAELALKSLTTGDLEPDQARGGRVKQRTVGPITTVWADNAPVGTVYSKAESILAPFLRNAAAMPVVRG